MTHEVVYDADGCEYYDEQDTETPLEAAAREDARLHNLLIHGEDSETGPCAHPRPVDESQEVPTA